jgi:type II secretory pathway component PulF
MDEKPVGSSNAGVLTTLTVGVHGVLVAWVLYFLLIQVPKLEVIYASFGTGLPTLTLIVVSCAKAVGCYGLLAVPALSALLVADGWGFYRLYRARRYTVALAWSLAILFVVLVGVMLITISFYQPFFELVNKVNEQTSSGG